MFFMLDTKCLIVLSKGQFFDCSDYVFSYFYSMLITVLNGIHFLLLKGIVRRQKAREVNKAIEVLLHCPVSEV